MRTIELPEDRTNVQVLVSHPAGHTPISEEIQRETGNYSDLIGNDVLASWIIDAIRTGKDITHPDTFEVTVIVPPDKEETYGIANDIN